MNDTVKWNSGTISREEAIKKAKAVENLLTKTGHTVAKLVIIPGFSGRTQVAKPDFLGLAELLESLGIEIIGEEVRPVQKQLPSEVAKAGIPLSPEDVARMNSSSPPAVSPPPSPLPSRSPTWSSPSPLGDYQKDAEQQPSIVQPPSRLMPSSGTVLGGPPAQQNPCQEVVAPSTRPPLRPL